MTRLAVTGASGYVGGRLVAHLAARGDTEIRAITRRHRPWLAGHQVEIDLSADDAVEQLGEALEGCHAVIHLAAPNEVSPDADLLLRDTVVATRRVVEAARRNNIERVIYLSTMHVYGAAVQEGARLTEDVLPQPRHPYAIGRLASEHLVQGAPDPVVLRLTNAVGAPADASVSRWTLVANDLARQAATTGSIRLATAGHQARDFCALSDVCRWLAECAAPSAVPAGVYNVGAGTTRSILELAEMVAEAAAQITGTRPPVQPGPDTPGTRSFHIDVGRATAVGLRSEVPLADEVAATVRACRRWFPTGGRDEHDDRTPARSD